jgi:hypothetical protein
MLNHYRKNLRAAVGSSAGPCGYTLATSLGTIGNP